MAACFFLIARSARQISGRPSASRKDCQQPFSSCPLSPPTAGGLYGLLFEKTGWTTATLKLGKAFTCRPSDERGRGRARCRHVRSRRR